MQYTVSFGTGSTRYFFQESFEVLKSLVSPDRSIIVTDRNVAELHIKMQKDYRTIILPAGEKYKC